VYDICAPIMQSMYHTCAYTIVVIIVVDNCDNSNEHFIAFEKTHTYYTVHTVYYTDFGNVSHVVWYSL